MHDAAERRPDDSGRSGIAVTELVVETDVGQIVSPNSCLIVVSMTKSRRLASCTPLMSNPRPVFPFGWVTNQTRAASLVHAMAILQYGGEAQEMAEFLGRPHLRLFRGHASSCPWASASFVGILLHFFVGL